MRYGKMFIALVTAAFLLAAVFFGKSEYSWDGTVCLSAQVASPEGTEEITCWEKEDDEYYLFLPGYAQLSQVRLRTNTTAAVYLNDQRISDGMTCENLQLEVPYDLCYRADGNERHVSLTLVRSGDVPTLYIDTASGSMEHIHEVKGNEEPGNLRLYTAEGKLDHMSNLESIKGRGNSTWELAKKPYNLTLNTEGDLLGMGTAQRWILLANVLDASQLKNKIAYDLAGDAGLDYSPDSEWVDLYLNGKYAGLYLLCERNEVHPQRVAISEEGSFLVSKDWEWRFEKNGHSFITTQANAALRIHSSDMPEASLRNIWQSAENAILAEDGVDPVTGKHWRELIDLDSWATKYLVEEVLGNVDASTLSQFFYYDGSDTSGKIYAGPVWDFDLSMSGSEKSWLEDRDQFYGNMPGVWGSGWFHALYHDAEFYSRITQIYETTFRPLLEQLLESGLDAYGARIQQAAKVNQIRWRTTDAGEEQQAMREYLQSRMEFLNRIWVEKEEYVMVTVKDYDGTKTTFALRPGEYLTDLPMYESDETTLVYGWFYYGTGTPFDPAQPIYEDIHIELAYDTIEAPEQEPTEPQAQAEEVPEEPISLLKLGPAMVFLVMLAAVCCAGLLRRR